jgi:hypothetical protein
MQFAAYLDMAQPKTKKLLIINLFPGPLHKHVLLKHLIFSPKDRGSMFLQNVDVYFQVHMALQPEDQHWHITVTAEKEWSSSLEAKQEATVSLMMTRCVYTWLHPPHP